MKKENIFKVYNSTSELAEVLNNTQPHKAWHDDTVFSESDDFLKKWAGETPSDADYKLSHGDGEAASRIKAQGELLADKTDGRIPRIETAIIGCLPSVPNYLRGVPNNMLRVISEPRQTPVIDMYILCTIYDGISVDAVAKAGAMIANLIAACEANEIRVNLWACFGVMDRRRHNNQFGMSVCLKDADAPLNLLNVGYCICNRAMCRITFLQWLERNVSYRINRYGQPMTEQTFKDAFNLDGVFLNVVDIVENNRDMDWLEKKVNDYMSRISTATAYE